MYKYTTAPFTFNLPVEISTLSEVRISFCQNNKVLITKALNNCTTNTKQLNITLTQEETALFDSQYAGQVQLRVKTTNNEVFNSEVFNFDVKKSFDKEIL